MKGEFNVKSIIPFSKDKRKNLAACLSCISRATFGTLITTFQSMSPIVFERIQSEQIKGEGRGE